MTNKQLAAARKAQNRYPEVSFRAHALGVVVGGTLVEIPDTMAPAEVERVLKLAAANAA
jgi:hypothetical protein